VKFNEFVTRILSPLRLPVRHPGPCDQWFSAVRGQAPAKVLCGGDSIRVSQRKDEHLIRPTYRLSTWKRRATTAGAQLRSAPLACQV